MRTKHLGFCLMIFSLLGLLGCIENKNDYSKQGVCIIDNASIRSEASKNGKWLSSLSLGETVKIEGKVVKDPADPKNEYYRVKLSDGQKGYVNTYYIVRGAYVGAVQAPAKVYKRPDLIAETDKKFEMLDIVAIEEETDSWVRVTGEGRATSGWIVKTFVRSAKEDVVTAVSLRKALTKKEKTITKEEIERFVATLAYPENYFAVKVLKQYESVETTEPVVSPDVQTVATNSAEVQENSIESQTEQ